MLVCLLSSSELGSLGVSLKEYEDLCAKLPIKLLVHPMVEMAPIQPCEAKAICEVVACHLGSDPEHRILLHCRGGMGRAGTLAAGMLLHAGAVATPDAAIAHVRRQRSAKAIESRKQEDCVKYFQAFLQQEIAERHTLGHAQAMMEQSALEGRLLPVAA